MPVRMLLMSLLRSRLERGRTELLLIIGHIRSGSSLLVHLLASHPEIVGFGEIHRPYTSHGDHIRNAWHIARGSGQLRVRERYLLDKVLHTRLGPSLDLLEAWPARALLLARDPRRAIPSILDLGVDEAPTDAAAGVYFRERLEVLERVGRTLGRSRCRLLTYHDLTHRTEVALREMSGFLELSSPLSPEYDMLWSTGKPGLGDSQGFIREGTIVRRERQYRSQPDPTVVESADARFADFLEACSGIRMVAGDPP